jgi:protocatechuate 3,4-dioxygenase, beta subunit
MASFSAVFGRRRFLQGGAAVGAMALFGSECLTSEAFAEELLRTPPLTEGPFYPDNLPLDTDNDLIIINDSITPAVGEITHLSGRVLDAGGSPLKDATVEIWQCDAKQVYLNTRDSVPKAKQRDANFQGFGRFTTGSSGEYRFRTIKPVAYPGRPAPHIHFKVKKGDRELLTTQLFIRGYPGNARDGVYGGVGDLVDRELVQVDFKPIENSKIGEFSASFEIVLGRTPDERDLTPRRSGERE